MKKETIEVTTVEKSKVYVKHVQAKCAGGSVVVRYNNYHSEEWNHLEAVNKLKERFPYLTYGTRKLQEQIDAQTARSFEPACGQMFTVTVHEAIQGLTDPNSGAPVNVCEAIDALLTGKGTINSGHLAKIRALLGKCSSVMIRAGLDALDRQLQAGESINLTAQIDVVF